MHPVEQINVIIGRIYRGGMTTTSGGTSPFAIKTGIYGLPRRGWIKDPYHEGYHAGEKGWHDYLPHRPSSELPFHRAIYEARPEITAIIHAHPPALVAFSIAGIVPDTKIVPQAHHICGDVGFAPYGTPGSEDLGEKIAREVSIYPLQGGNYGKPRCGTGRGGYDGCLPAVRDA